MHSRAKNLPSLCRTVALAGLAVLAVVDAHADEPPSPIDNPEVIAAIRTAWLQTINGRSGTEASFRLDGNPSAYLIIPSPPTNQFRKHSVELIPGLTFAVFHIHTIKGDPAPSKPDRAVADRFKLRMYTIHRDGLFLYDPATKQTVQLQQGVAWMDRAPRSGR